MINPVRSPRKILNFLSATRLNKRSSMRKTAIDGYTSNGIKVEVSGGSGLDKKDIGRILRAAFKMARVETANVSVAFVGKKEIKRLNSIYRQKNKATDILSFGFSRVPGEGKGGSFRFGELVISLEEVRLNAKAKGTSIKKELCLLLAHGALHLCGYDHEKLSDRKKMFGLQDKILKRLL